MKIVVIGGTGLIGSKVVAKLQALGHEALAAALVEIAGPEALALDAFARRYLDARHDARRIIADPAALYFVTVLDDRSLAPGDHPRLGKVSLEDWLRELPA